jgi:hypothetical protein
VLSSLQACIHGSNQQNPVGLLHSCGGTGYGIDGFHLIPNSFISAINGSPYDWIDTLREKEEMELCAKLLIQRVSVIL